MDNNNLQQENKNLKSRNEQLQAKLDAIEKSNQQKTKFQLWLGRVGLGFLLGPGLKSSMQQLYSELPANVNRDTLADVTTQVIWRFTRIGLLAVFVALIPTVLLWQQNQKIEQQTKLFQKQNDKIDSQIQLEESSRRGNLIVMMSNIMDKVDEEIRRAQEQGDSSRSLSPQLIGRIGALSYAFRPYRFLEDSILIKKPLSPERGQLLLALVNSDLDSLTYRNIYREATFEQAYLEDAKLSKTDMRDADLSKANLRGADFSNSNLSKTDLRDTDLSKANLRGAILSNTQLWNVNLGYANLRNANLSNAQLWSVNLKYATLSNINLRDAILIKVNLNNANLRDVDLTDVKVIDKNWLTKLKEWNVVGSNQVLEKYKVDTIPQKDNYGDRHYLIKPKS